MDDRQKYWDFVDEGSRRLNVTSAQDLLKFGKDEKDFLNKSPRFWG